MKKPLISVASALLVTALISLPTSGTTQEKASPQQGITQEELESNIIDGLRRTPSIRSQALLVEADNFIITLSGSADNLADSNNAAEVAKSTNGVKAVVNQIVVQPPVVDDETLTSNATYLMTGLISADASRVKAAASNGVITLSGSVNSLAEKRLLESELAFLRGVGEIDNQLTVDERTDRSDAELELIIKRLMENSAALDRSEIMVKVDGPVANLSGNVESARQKLLAITTAEIPGITKVDALQLQIEADGKEAERRRLRYASISDESIQETVELAWQYHPLLAGVVDDLVAVANRGNVVLSGKVPSALVKEKAGEVAASVIGVAGVKNRIAVHWDSGETTDEEIVDAVTRAVARDAYLEYSDVIPRSRNAHLHLYGMVDTRFEKERAGMLASVQPGVVHVANYLTISNTDADLTDYEIKEAIEEKLTLMNTVSGVDVSVIVENGVPVFEGRVSTWFEWQSLLRIAKEAGARRPHLDVDIELRPQPTGAQLYVPG